MPNDEWMTPPPFLDLVREVFDGTIELDPASNKIAQQYVKAQEYYSIFEGNDGLILPWGSRKVFCNPPYSKQAIRQFSVKAMVEVSQNKTELIMLVNSSTDTDWYHMLAENCSTMLLWRRRIKFWKLTDDEALANWELTTGEFGNSPRYLNTVFYFGKNTKKFKDVFVGNGLFFEISK